MPGRQITDLIHQVYLVQDYVDSFDEDALLVLLDMEKAFDRCSWDFLKKSMQALGLGKDIRRWIHAIYDNERPPERKIKMNGEKSYQFALGSGVAHGCPLSPAAIPIHRGTTDKNARERRKTQGSDYRRTRAQGRTVRRRHSSDARRIPTPQETI